MQQRPDRVPGRWNDTMFERRDASVLLHWGRPELRWRRALARRPLQLDSQHVCVGLHAELLSTDDVRDHAELRPSGMFVYESARSRVRGQRAPRQGRLLAEPSGRMRVRVPDVHLSFGVQRRLRPGHLRALVHARPELSRRGGPSLRRPLWRVLLGRRAGRLRARLRRSVRRGGVARTGGVDTSESLREFAHRRRCACGLGRRRNGRRIGCVVNNMGIACRAHTTRRNKNASSVPSGKFVG